MANAIKDLQKQFDPLGFMASNWGDSVLGIKKPEDIQAPEAPTPPAIDPNSSAERDAKVLEDRRRRILASKAMTNPTGGLGVTSGSGAVAKTLLGA